MEENQVYGMQVKETTEASCVAWLMRLYQVKVKEQQETGGDEFVSFLPNRNEEEMEALIRKLREGAKEYNMMGETLSVSFGFYTMRKAAALGGVKRREV